MADIIRCVIVGAAVTLLALGGWARPAEATLISTDWKATGDGLLTRDTDVGLEWLDLTVTAGMSFMDVHEALEDEHSDLYGFRYADNDWSDFVGHSAGFYATTTPEALGESVEHLLDLIGVTVYGAGGELAYGSVGYVYDSPFYYESCLAGQCYDELNTVLIAKTENPRWGRVDSYATYAPDDRDPAVGTYLVRVAQVPEAPTAVFVAAGLFLVTLAARRRAVRPS